MNELMNEKVKIGKWGGSTVVPLDTGILTKMMGVGVGSEVEIDYSQLPEKITILFPPRKKPGNL